VTSDTPIGSAACGEVLRSVQPIAMVLCFGAEYAFEQILSTHGKLF
jgi:hypothetical protein